MAGVEELPVQTDETFASEDEEEDTTHDQGNQKRFKSTFVTFFKKHYS